MKTRNLTLTVVLLSACAHIAWAETAATRRNHERAEARCQEVRAAGGECKVSPTVGCGVGWSKDQRFRDGGNAWYTCRRNAYGTHSEEHRQECLRWCDAHQDRCTGCSTLPGCGPGFERVESFRGAGNNWFACKARHAGNRAWCESWCAEQPGCVGCEPSVGCGPGRTSLKKFDTYQNYLAPTSTSMLVILDGIANAFDGSAWYACRRR